MRCLLQRVTSASVSVAGETIGATGPGVLILTCAMEGDAEMNVEAMARKVVNLRIFRDGDGKMNRSILDVGGEALIVSQFTLATDTSRGNRPGFSSAAHPNEGKRFYELFCARNAGFGISIAKGRFGADMQVSLVNDGPLTIWLEK